MASQNNNWQAWTRAS